MLKCTSERGTLDVRVWDKICAPDPSIKARDQIRIRGQDLVGQVRESNNCSIAANVGANRAGLTDFRH